MTIEDKLAVLKLAGYKIHSHRHYSGGGRIWDWSNETADFESASYFNTRGQAVRDALEHFQITPKEVIGCPK